MSRWFRHYAGMMRDEKLVRVAVKAKQPVERVVWIWGAILESAAEINEDGLFEVDAAEVAYFLRADEADICAVLDGLADAGRLAAGRVVKWGDRQYQSDKSAERQARYRERRRGKDRNADDQQAGSDVTPPSRDGQVTLQETETDNRIPDANASGADAPPTDPRSELFAEGSKTVQRWTGKSNDAARKFIGKLLKSANDDCVFVLSKIREAEAERMSNPVAWVSAAVLPRSTSPPKKITHANMWNEDAIAIGIIDDPASPSNRRLETGLARGQNQGSNLARRLAGA